MKLRISLSAKPHVEPMLPNAHYGDVDTPAPDWRDKKLVDKSADDDEQLAETPDDVVSMLGFDPLELEFDDK